MRVACARHTDWRPTDNHTRTDSVACYRRNHQSRYVIHTRYANRAHGDSGSHLHTTGTNPIFTKSYRMDSQITRGGRNSHLSKIIQ